MEKPWEYLGNRTIAILGVETPQGLLARDNGRFPRARFQIIIIITTTTITTITVLILSLTWFLDF